MVELKYPPPSHYPQGRTHSQLTTSLSPPGVSVSTCLIISKGHSNKNTTNKEEGYAFLYATMLVSPLINPTSPIQVTSIGLLTVGNATASTAS